MISTLTPVFSHRDSPRDSTEDTGQRLFHVKVTLSRWAQPDRRGKGGLKRWRRSNGRDHREDPKNTSLEAFHTAAEQRSSQPTSVHHRDKRFSAGRVSGSVAELEHTWPSCRGSAPSKWLS